MILYNFRPFFRLKIIDVLCKIHGNLEERNNIDIE